MDNAACSIFYTGFSKKAAKLNGQPGRSSNSDCTNTDYFQKFKPDSIKVDTAAIYF